MQYDENAEKYGYDGEMTPLKCDKLTAYKADVTISVYGTIADAEVYLKDKVDAALSEKDKEIAGLKAAAKEPSVPNRTCRKCGSAGTLMYMPIVKDGRTYWDLYNNKGMDYVVGIRCAHCGEVAFVTKQTHEYELRKQKYKRCLAMAELCRAKRDEIIARTPTLILNHPTEYLTRWQNRWMKLAEKLKPINSIVRSEKGT